MKVGEGCSPKENWENGCSVGKTTDVGYITYPDKRFLYRSKKIADAHFTAAEIDRESGSDFPEGGEQQVAGLNCTLPIDLSPCYSLAGRGAHSTAQLLPWRSLLL